MNCVSSTNSGRTNRKALKKGLRPEITVVSAKPMLSALASESSSLMSPGDRSSVVCGKVVIPAPPVIPPPPRPSSLPPTTGIADKLKSKDIVAAGKAAVSVATSSIATASSTVPAIPKRPAPTLINASAKSTGISGKVEEKVKAVMVAEAKKAVVNGVKSELAKAAPIRPAPPPPAGKKCEESPPLSPTRHAPGKPVKYQSLDRKSESRSRPTVTRSATLPGRPDRPSPARPQTLPLVTETHGESPRKAMRPTILTAAGAMPVKLRKTENSNKDTSTPNGDAVNDAVAVAKEAAVVAGNIGKSVAQKAPSVPNGTKEMINNTVSSTRETIASAVGNVEKVIPKKGPPPVKSKPPVPRKPSMEKLASSPTKVLSPEVSTVDFSKVVHLPDSLKSEPPAEKPSGRPVSAYFCGSDSSGESSPRSESPSLKPHKPQKPPRTALTPGKPSVKKSKSMVVRRRHVSPPSSPPPPPKSPLDRVVSLTIPSSSMLENGLQKSHLRRSKSNVASTGSAVVERRESGGHSIKSKPARPQTGPYMVMPESGLRGTSDDDLGDHDEQTASCNQPALAADTTMTDEAASPSIDDHRPIKPSRPAPPVRNTSIKSPTSESPESKFMEGLKAKLDVSEPHAMAIKDHQSTTEKELSFATGDLIFLIKKTSSRHYLGRLNNFSGLVSADCVEVFIDVPDAMSDGNEDEDLGGKGFPALDTRLPHAMAVHRHIASGSHQLAFEPGDVIMLNSEHDDGMLEGTCNGRSGTFPASFVAVLIPLSKQGDGLVNGQQIDRSATNSSAEGPHCRAVYAFSSDIPEDLSFESSQIIKLIDHVNEEWLRGELNDKIGLFPKAYVEIVEDLPKTVVLPPPPDQPKALFRAKAIYDFHSAQPNELSLHTGDVVTVTAYVNDDWFEGEIVGRSGIFPVSFVQRVAQDEDVAEETDLDNLPPPPTEYALPMATALYDFDAMQEDELTFPAGAKIYLRKSVESNWFEGSYNGIIGKFPAGFVEVVTPLPDNC